MELRHLRYFIAVAEEENVTRAASRLHLAQPSLSRQIRDLERDLGVPLFDHSTRNLRLNAAGRYFLSEAREAVTRFEEAIRSVRDFADGREGELHVGYAPSLTTGILPQALREFHLGCPRVRVELHDLSTEEMLEGLREGSLHTALLVKPSKPALNGLVYNEITHLRPCVAMPHTHALSSAQHLAAEDLVKESFLAYTRSSYPEYHQWLGRIFGENDTPRIYAEYDSSTSLIAAIESGCGLAVVQQGFESLSGERLLIQKIRGTTKTRLSFGVAHRKDDLSKATSQFVSASLAAISLTRQS